MQESDIVHEVGAYYVARCEFSSRRKAPKRQGFEVVQNGVTHGKLVMTVDISGEQGLKRATDEADRRACVDLGQKLGWY